MQIKKIDGSNVIAFDDKSVFVDLDFSQSTIIEIEGTSVSFNFPALVAAKKQISKMEQGPVKAMFNDILGNFRTKSEHYYKNNPETLKQHIELGWVNDPTNNFGFVH